jgi:ClpP class serine protease
MSKAHSLVRLTNKLVATPQMMEAQYFDKIASLLEDRNVGDMQLALTNEAKNTERQLTYNADTKVGIIELTGPLTYLHYQPMCGEAPTSYQSLVADVESMISMGAKTVVFDTDSPGGEAYGVFETAKHIRTMADKAGVKLLTYVDGMAASAAYALASVSDEIIMNPSAEVGSIGVVVRLRNANKAMKSMGVEDTYVFAGKSKIPFNAEGDFAEEFLSDLQEKVNVLYGEFTSHVAQMRGMTPEAVTNTEAKTFLADKAIQLGLADKAMEVEEFYSYLSTVASGETNSKMLTARFLNKSKQEDTAKMQELVELQAAFAALTDEKTQMEAQLSQAVEALTSAQAEASAVKEQLAQFQTEVETARLEAEAQAAQAKLDARQSRLEASVGKEEAVVLMASLGSLEDAAFETVAASFEKKAKAVEASPLFTEIGVGDQGDEEALSDTAKVLKAQYKNS